MFADSMSQMVETEKRGVNILFGFDVSVVVLRGSGPKFCHVTVRVSNTNTRDPRHFL